MGDTLEIVSIGVGHGDATLLSWKPDGAAPYHILVDGGPKAGGNRIEQCLAERGIRRLDLLVLSHVDADHVDGLLELTKGKMSVGSYWGPCIEAFERHEWLFPERVKRGLEKARELQERLVQRGTACIYPFEGHEDRSEDQRLHVHVLWPAPRLLERLLLGDDALELFIRHPMPQGWLLDPPTEPPLEEIQSLSNVRARLRDSTFLHPSEAAAAESEPQGNIDELIRECGQAFKIEPDFFGNSVLNDTSLVLSVEALLDGTHRRIVLLPGDLENWFYLTAQHGKGLDCDVLKAPHHGGRVYIEQHERAAYDDVYQWLRPRVVMVSATGQHGLPRADFRDAALRWGATLFCPCRRTQEIVVGDRLAEKCCRKVFKCEDANTSTSLELSATNVLANAPACLSEATEDRARIVRVTQHVIEPSTVAERMTTGELLKHIRWSQQRLAELHRQRRTVSDWKEATRAIDVDVLKQLGQAEGRHRMVAEIETVLKEAARRGELWFHEAEYNVAARAYRNPREQDRKNARSWFQKRSAVLMRVKDANTSLELGPLEILNRACIDTVTKLISATVGYPSEAFRDLFWPDLVDNVVLSWHGFMLKNEWASDALLVLSPYESLGDIRNELRPESPGAYESLDDIIDGPIQRLWESWRSDKSAQIDSDRAWTTYEGLGEHFFVVGWEELRSRGRYIDLLAKYVHEWDPIVGLAENSVQIW